MNSNDAGLTTLHAEALRMPPLDDSAVAEVLSWMPDAPASMPDAEITVLLWVRDRMGGEDWCAGWWDGQDWRDCSSGGVVDGQVLRWADVRGPEL